MQMFSDLGPTSKMTEYVILLVSGYKICIFFTEILRHDEKYL